MELSQRLGEMLFEGGALEIPHIFWPFVSGHWDGDPCLTLKRALSHFFAFKRKILAESPKNLMAVFSSQRPNWVAWRVGEPWVDQFFSCSFFTPFPPLISGPAPGPGLRNVLWGCFLRHCPPGLSQFSGGIRRTHEPADTTGSKAAWVLMALPDLKSTPVDPMSHSSPLPTQRRVWPFPLTSHPWSGEETKGDSQALSSEQHS